MANYVLYNRANGDEIKLKINAVRAAELEERFGASIPEKTKELDKISVAAEFVAAAIDGDSYGERRQTAYAIFDEMAENGETIEDYQYLILDILVKAGFMNGERVKLLKAAKEQQETLLAGTIKALQTS